MTGWDALTREAPNIAAAGLRLGIGDGGTPVYLATVRKDGGPRVHPVMTVLAGASLYSFIVNLGWKYRDLKREGRYALHSSGGVGEEFYCTGPAIEVRAPEVRELVRDACGRRLGNLDFEALFELGLERALHTKWDGWGTAEAWPRFEKWSS